MNDKKVTVLRSKSTLIEDLKPLLIAFGIFFGLAFIACAYEEFFVEKPRCGPIKYWVYTVDMETAIGERQMLEHQVNDQLNREAYERVQDGSASGNDYDRASQYENDHSV